MKKSTFTLDFPIVSTSESGLNGIQNGASQSIRRRLSLKQTQSKPIRPVRYDRQYRFIPSQLSNGADSIMRIRFDPRFLGVFKSSKRKDDSEFSSWVYFELLDQESLLNLQSNFSAIISKDAVVEFLELLHSNWLDFLTNELEIIQSYLNEFVWRDILNQLEEFLEHSTEKLTVKSKKSEYFDELEEQILCEHESLRDVAQIMHEKQSKQRISDLTQKVFAYYAAKNLKTVKQKIFRIFDVQLESNALMERNIKTLAEILLCIDNRLLVEKMKSAFGNRNYALKVDIQMSQQLLKYLGVESLISQGEPLE
ncbi:uncharacterized protein LOC142349465 [Convolutriloba macropyga]|uniref:uncharacterized protein LOC142349465 n=1 Tax=Convolutriloba macropyga TaxID=536237 RepID=UPI003F51E25B